MAKKKKHKKKKHVGAKRSHKRKRRTGATYAIEHTLKPVGKRKKRGHKKSKRRIAGQHRMTTGGSLEQVHDHFVGRA